MRHLSIGDLPRPLESLTPLDYLQDKTLQRIRFIVFLNSAVAFKSGESKLPKAEFISHAEG